VEERSVRIAFVLASATAAGAFGGCIACECNFLNFTPHAYYRTDISNQTVSDMPTVQLGWKASDGW